jgi:cell wall-associated NlpC family hydrolase
MSPGGIMNPKPGDIGLCRISGLTGVAVSAGQRLIGSGSYFTHAFIYMGAGEVIQAQPGGAKRVLLAEALDGRKRVAFSDFDLNPAQRSAICAAAERFIGTPYSFLDYLAIAEARIARIDSLEEFVGETGHMICSQLVDECYRQAGIELFPGRIPGDVAPGDLAKLIGV